MKTDASIIAAGTRLAGSSLRGKTDSGTFVDFVERLVSAVEIDAALAIVEQVCGVLPLLALFERGPKSGPVFDGIERGKTRAALGLFTPTPAFSWSASAVPAKVRAGKVTLTGEVQIACPRAEWVVVLAGVTLERREQTELHMAAFSTAAKGVTRSGTWLTLERVWVPAEFLSSPMDLRNDRDPWRSLDAYAGVYAWVAALYARRGLRAMRQALRTTVRGGQPFNTSQVLAMGTTELEVQVILLESASRDHILSRENGRSDGTARGLALAASASRLLSQVASRTEELRAKAGVLCSGPFASPISANGIDAVLGGQLLIESELARARGIQ